RRRTCAVLHPGPFHTRPPLRQVTLPDGRNVRISRGIGDSPPIPIGWRRGSDPPAVRGFPRAETATPRNEADDIMLEGCPRGDFMTLPEFLSQDSDGYIHVAGHRIGLQDLVYY